jgi:carbon monoxide dehydrogenase subunit G
MSMEMSGQQRIVAPRQRVWEALNDPAVLRACIPGCQSLEKEGDDRFLATAEIKIGPIGARFKGNVTLGDLDPPNGYTIEGQGNGGIAGSAKGAAKVQLTEDSGATIVAYTVDAQVGGRMAQLGGPIIDATAKQLAGKFFSRFGEIVEGGEAAVGAPADAPGVAPAVTVPAAADAAPVPVAAEPRGFVIPTTAPAPAGGGLWGWIGAVALAIVAGFLMGRHGAAPTWVLVAILAIVVASAAAYQAGRRTGAVR